MTIPFNGETVYFIVLIKYIPIAYFLMSLTVCLLSPLLISSTYVPFIGR